MKISISRAILCLATCCLDARRGEWSLAMRAEFETAVAEGEPLRFASGCLMAAWREMLTTEEGRFFITSYVLVLGLLIPMAALQIGCAVFGLPYLYPGERGLPGAMLQVGGHEHLMLDVYRAVVPSLALLQLLTGFGHVRIAWRVLEKDWDGVARSGIRTLAAAATLILCMGAFFLNGRQALLQGAILAVELATIAVMVRWYAQLPSATPATTPG